MTEESNTLHFEFKRTPEMFVEGAFAATRGIDDPPEQKAKNWLSRIAVWVLLFLVFLAFFRLLEMGNADSQLVGGLAIGIIFGFICSVLWALVWQKKLRKKYAAAVSKDETIAVTISPDGIRSALSFFELNASWDRVGSVWIEGENLYVLVELYVVMIPESALSNTMTLAQLSDIIEQRRSNYEMNVK